MQLNEESVAALVARLAGDVAAGSAAAEAASAQPEDQLKTPVKVLLEDIGKLLDLDIVATTEAYMAELSVRPDVAVSVDGLVQGHIELKAPGKGANPNKLKGHDRQQWQKLRSHPNLIYTDGSEWRHFRLGDLQGKAVKLATGEFDDDWAPSRAAVSGLRDLVVGFLNWEPIVPTTPRALAAALAPLCRLLRDEALAAVQTPHTDMAILGADWKRFFFGDADDAQFADAYAQTVTYALLLARFEGETEMSGDTASKRLDKNHSLLAQVLRLLRDPQVRDEVEMPLELLERTIGAIDPRALRGSERNDPWLYFYEDFLAAYDPKLRNNRGVYYTPAEVVSAQVALASELLRERLGKKLGLVDDEVVLLDPATGTGTYLLGALEYGLERARAEFGEGVIGNRATSAAKNFHGFELLVGPYAVAHTRLAKQVLDNGGTLPAEGIGIYLTDTLESPYTHPQHQQQMTLAHKQLSEENERARRVKRDSRILVCLGNPPYDRQQIDAGDEGMERKGGWVRNGDGKDQPILEDFLRPVREAGQGGQLKNLYNDYVYFWRWALWKVFEDSSGPGVVTFITASSYLRGPAFAGMRRVMRETFDEMWIIDLGGDNLGARKTENVFAIQTPVAIAIGIRDAGPQPESPAKTHYCGDLIDGARSAKLEQLAGIEQFSDLDWQECFFGWDKPLLPESAGDYFDWPLLTDLFPWQHSGAQWKRTWPIGPDKKTLGKRWQALTEQDPATRGGFMRETAARNVKTSVAGLSNPKSLLEPIETLRSGAPSSEIVPYAYRSLDRQYALADNRLCDRPRPPIWRAHGDRQVYMTSLLTGVLGTGPGAMVAAEIPDLHHFRGSFGGRDVIPLWRNSAATEPNVTAGLLEQLSETLGQPVTPQDLLAYAYGILAATDYTDRFSEELAIPGPRVPVTRDADLFRRAAGLGARLIWLHTYGERFVPAGEARGDVPQGKARCTHDIPADPDSYPEEFSFDQSDRQLRVGKGVFEPVTGEVFEFSISGLEVVKSWLRYRMRGGAGKKSSPLDDIEPYAWPPEYTLELCRLLWIVEHTLAMQDELSEVLAAIVAGEAIRADELPNPTDEERQPPSEDASQPQQMSL